MKGMAKMQKGSGKKKTDTVNVRNMYIVYRCAVYTLRACASVCACVCVCMCAFVCVCVCMCVQNTMRIYISGAESPPRSLFILLLPLGFPWNAHDWNLCALLVWIQNHQSFLAWWIYGLAHSCWFGFLGLGFLSLFFFRLGRSLLLPAHFPNYIRPEGCRDDRLGQCLSSREITQ